MVIAGWAFTKVIDQYVSLYKPDFNLEVKKIKWILKEAFCGHITIPHHGFVSLQVNHHNMVF